MPSSTWGPRAAEVYDQTSAPMFDPAVLDPAVDLLAELADGGPVLELAIGTGRVALPLSARGLEVSGIELSPHMVGQLRAKPGAEAVDVTIGDMTTTRVPGEFRLVYAVWNCIHNVTTQEEQLAVFANAAAHLRPGGRFVVEMIVPQVPMLGDHRTPRVFEHSEEHLGVDTFDDPVGQVLRSHHWMDVDGQFVHMVGSYRYIWPSEMDLMARLAGLRLVDRWAGWSREEFNSDSTNQVVVYER
jgi:SAM-dependent methyltransferase